jgi:hypothetical protein
MANPPPPATTGQAAALEPTAQADRHAALPPKERLMLTRTQSRRPKLTDDTVDLGDGD